MNYLHTLNQLRGVEPDGDHLAYIKENNTFYVYKETYDLPDDGIDVIETDAGFFGCECLVL